LGIGHVVSPGTIDMALRDGELVALLPGKHAYRTHALQPKPYQVHGSISFMGSGGGGSSSSPSSRRQEFDGGIVLTIGPSQVGFAFNVPSDSEASSEMGSGVTLIPPGTWVIRSPILVSTGIFETTTTGRDSGRGVSYIQELEVNSADALAKPRLVYVPYNHSAMFIDGTSSLICDQGFHWANPGIEIAGPWPQHEQRLTYSVEAKTLDNMVITIEAESWVQMVNPERYVRVAGKEVAPGRFVEDKLTAKVKQHVARINALQIRAAEAEAPPPPREQQHPSSINLMDVALLPVTGLPVPAEPLHDEEGGLEDVMVTRADPETPSEAAVFNRIKSLLDEVRGFVDGTDDGVTALATEVQAAISRAGLNLISMAALSVNLPAEIASQISQANREAIIAQTEQATNHAKAQKHIAEKYAEIRKKKADREEETRDAENQVTLQRSKARLAEAEEFAKRQAKRAEQKVEQSLELQALEHRMVREQARIDNELALLEKEAELIAKQAEIEAHRLALAKQQQARHNLEADTATYRATAEARAAREAVNQQTLVAEIMRNLGQPLHGARILTVSSAATGAVGGGGEAEAAAEGASKMLPQLLALREIMGYANEMDPGAR